jgi:hypothetical protein
MKYKSLKATEELKAAEWRPVTFLYTKMCRTSVQIRTNRCRSPGRCGTTENSNMVDRSMLPSYSNVNRTCVYYRVFSKFKLINHLAQKLKEAFKSYSSILYHDCYGNIMKSLHAFQSISGVGVFILLLCPGATFTKGVPELSKLW